MPAIETDTLRIELPADWDVFQDGSQVVAHGTNDEEVIVSTTRITGTGTENEKRAVTDSVKKRLVESMRRAAAHPELVSVAPESERSVDTRTLLIRLSSATSDNSTRFEQFGIICGAEAVLLTYEAPATASQSFVMFEHAIECAAKSPKV